MAVCPQCGGSARQLLAPGYYECTSETEELVDVLRADMHGGPGDRPIYRTRTCGVRYQSGEGMTGAVQCWCGMFAVSACSECGGEPRCGQHIVKVEGRVLCSVHAPAAAEAAKERTRAQRQRQEDEDRRRHRAWKQAIVEWEAVVARALAAIEDPTERLVRAVVEIGCEIGGAYTPKLQRHIPTTWDDQEIADWFLETVRGQPTDNVSIPGAPDRAGRTPTAPGWKFPVRSTPFGLEWGPTILAEGRVRYGPDTTPSWEPAPGEGFWPKDLQEMLTLCELPPLGVPPRPEAPHSKKLDEQRLRSWLRRFSEPEARLIAAVTYLTGKPDESMLEFFDSAVRIVCEELRPRYVLGKQSDLDAASDNPPWDSQELARWFVVRALEAGLVPDSARPTLTAVNTLFSRKIVEGPKQPGWQMRACGGTKGVTAYVLPDGSIRYAERKPPQGSQSERDLLERAQARQPVSANSSAIIDLSGFALQRMGRLLGIPAPPKEVTSRLRHDRPLIRIE